MAMNWLQQSDPNNPNWLQSMIQNALSPQPPVPAAQDGGTPPFIARPVEDVKPETPKPEENKPQPSGVPPPIDSSIAGSPDTLPPVAGQASSAPAATGSAAPPPTSFTGVAPVLSYDEWKTQNGDAPIPQRPRGPFDKIPDGQPGADSWGNRHNKLREALSFLGAGAAEFGGRDPWGTNGHPGEGMAVMQPWLADKQAQRTYDTNAPAMQEQANQSAYQKYVTDAHSAAQTNMLGQTATIQMPNGQIVQVPILQAGHLLGATAAAQSKENVAHINAASKEQVENLKVQVEQGKVSHFMLNQQTGKVDGYNNQGQVVITLDQAALPSMMAKTAQTVDYKEDQFGTIHALPKTTVTTPTAPGAAVHPPQVNGSSQAGAGAHAPQQSGGSIVPFQGKGAIQQVIGYQKDPNTGASRAVMVPAGEAQKYGLSGVGKADAGLMEKTTNARMLIPLFNSNDPNDPGLIQTVKKLDAEGKLGPLASRWNEFLAGTYGSGDPEFEKLRVLSGLGNTALMQVHVGNRGGSFMLEHFEDLANTKKLDGPTLLAGLEQEYKYINHKAMLPSDMNMTGNDHAPAKKVDWNSLPDAR